MSKEISFEKPVPSDNCSHYEGDVDFIYNILEKKYPDVLPILSVELSKIDKSITDSKGNISLTIDPRLKTINLA